MKIHIDPNWSYRQAVYHVKALKPKYDEVLASFSSFEPGKRADFIHSVRIQFYAMNLIEWQIDNLWQYMNNDMTLIKLILSSLRYK